jgi:hypothetical protein
MEDLKLGFNATRQSRVLSMAQAGAMILAAGRALDAPSKLTGRVDVHLSAAPGMTRKRNQPKGCRLCPDCVRAENPEPRTISANHDRCAGCSREREANG